jgi:hypothetical protein
MALKNENCTYISNWKWIKKVYCINSMHRILQIVKVKQLQSPNAPLNPRLFTLQTDMSWHSTTLHEMHKWESMFAQLECDIFSCIYQQIQVELYCTVQQHKWPQIMLLLVIIVSLCCHHAELLQSLSLKPEFQHIFTYFFSWYATSIMYHELWVLQPFSVNYYITIFLVHVLATGLLRKLPISLQTNGGCGGVKNKTHWLCFP